MKRPHLTLVVAAAFIVVVLAGATPQTPTQQPAPQVTRQEMTEIIASQNRLLFELAAERYASKASSRAVWVFAVSGGTSVRKLTDGRFTVVLLPGRANQDRIALLLYAEQYNSLTQKAMDKRLDAGEYDFLAGYYRVLQKYETGGDLHRDIVLRRLEIVEELRKGKNVDANAAAFRALDPTELATRLNLADIDNLEPELMTDLTSEKK